MKYLSVSAQFCLVVLMCPALLCQCSYLLQSSVGLVLQRSHIYPCCSVAGLWVGDCFIYNNSAWRLNYCIGGEVTTMYHLDRPMYLLGYLASHSKVYLIDKVSLVISSTQAGFAGQPVLCTARSSADNCIECTNKTNQKPGLSPHSAPD